MAFSVLHTALRFPSGFFYDGSLLDGVGITARAAAHHALAKCFGPLVVWDLADGREGRGRAGGGGGARGGSLHNAHEADFSVALFRGACVAGGRAR